MYKYPESPIRKCPFYKHIHSTQWGKTMLPTIRPCYFGFLFLSKKTRINGLMGREFID